MRHVSACILILAVLLPAAASRADWQSLDFDLTRKDDKAYATDLPAGAFTPNGLVLKLQSGQKYALMSTRVFDGDFSFDLQTDITERTGSGKVSIDVVLINDQLKCKVVGTFERSNDNPGSDRAIIQYFKDGKTVSGGDRDVFGHPGHRANFEWLRMHKEGVKVWFMQKEIGTAYRWQTVETGPSSIYEKENAEAFQVGFVIRAGEDCTATVAIKSARISSTALDKRDATRRAFFFDMGPVNQELEDEFWPVSEYTQYTKDKGYGWIIPDKESVLMLADGVQQLSDEEIAKYGFKPIPPGVESWVDGFLRQCYWLQLQDKKVFYSMHHGLNFIEFFKKNLDIRTPLERDGVGMGKPYQFAFDDRYQKDIEERRGAVYMDDDMAADFAVDVPNGRYNVLMGVGYAFSGYAGGERGAFNVEIEGRVRKMGMRPWWKRVVQNTIRDIEVQDGQLNLKFFCDVRRAMDPWANHDLASGWQVQYIVVLPAEDRELLGLWQWKIIKRRGEVVRRVTFTDGEPPVMRQEDGFLSLNGKPLYFLKTLENYWPGDSDHFIYYNLANVLSAKQSFARSEHFFKPDWEQLSYSDDYPWDTIDRMNTEYSWGYLASLHEDTILSFVPHAVSGEGNPTVDSRGRKNRYNIQPPLNSALGKEIQKEAYTMLANQMALHPANMGHMIYDQLWHPNQAGYDEQSAIQYWEWLKVKYNTVEALNAEWKREYKSFDEIQPPKTETVRNWQFTPEWTNFRVFRAWAQRQAIADAVKLVDELEPGHVSWGARGDYGTQSWYPAQYVDMFGWYSPFVAASAARYFGKTPISYGYSLSCEYASLDGRKQADHAGGGPVRNIGQEEADNYNKVIASVFKGAKGFFNEWASDGVTHAFHRTMLAKGNATDQFGNVASFARGATDGPKVKVERNALAVGAANGMLYRIGHLWLPAKAPQPQVLFPMVEASYFLPFFNTENPPQTDFEQVAMRIMRSTNLSADFISMPAVKDLNAYKVIVLAEPTVAISRADAKRIRQFVSAGGKLIMLNAAGFSDDNSPRRYGNEGEVYPLQEFADIGGYRLVAQGSSHKSYGKAGVRFVGTAGAPEFTDGYSVGSWAIDNYYELPEGSTSSVFLKGRIEEGGQDVALGVINKDRSVVVINVPDKTASPDLMHPLAKFVRRLTDSWNIAAPVTMGGVSDAWDLYAGCLVGEDYRLVTACNSGADDREFPLLVANLPQGQYAVIDVTGQGPETKETPEGGFVLADAPADVLVSKVSMVMSADQLAKGGIPTKLKARRSKVYLIRPMEQKVWNSVWPGSLAEFARRGVTVAYGTGPGEKQAAETIASAVTAMGFKAAVVPCGDIKTKKVHHEVRIKPENRDNKRHEKPETWPLVQAFDNEVVDTDQSLIVVGSLETNSLMTHMSKAGSFIYDKVGEKITADYPGAGRGVIGWSDAVNYAIYNMRSDARDAIVVGGSDAAGTTAAAATLSDLIRKHAIVKPLATRPAKHLTTYPSDVESEAPGKDVP